MKDQREGFLRRLFVRLALLALVGSGGFGSGGCARRGTGDFMKTINGIETGTDMGKVRKRLGDPDERHAGRGPVRPAPPLGSPEGVLVTVPSGVKYRQWIYKRGDSHYHVFFTPTVAKPGKWEVLAVRSAPASKVY